MLKRLINNPLSLIVVATVIVASFLVCISSNTNGYVYESKTISNKENTLCMMYETLPSSGIYEEQLGSSWPINGYIFNDEISGCKNGSELSWNQDNNQVIVKSDTKEQCYVYFDKLTAKHLDYINDSATFCTDAECALDELFEILVSNTNYVYWNDNYSSTTYLSNQIPTGSGLRGTFVTLRMLSNAYSNWANAPMYIKSTITNGDVTGHKACLWYNNHEFCLSPNYWSGDSATTKSRLKNDMENDLSISINDSNCSSTSDYISCSINGMLCGVYDSGIVACGASFGYCRVYGNGSTYCKSQ